MSTEQFVNYWIGQEPIELVGMPSYVNTVPLAFVGITADYSGLDFNFLQTNYDAAQIQSWVAALRAQGTNVLFSILDQKLGTIPANMQQTFVKNVVQSAQGWGVNGIDFDFEPPSGPTATLVPIMQQLRDGWYGGETPYFTAPIYSPWLGEEDLLRAVAAECDLITTMDYTPYPGYDATIESVESYISVIGDASKVAIGMSCMVITDDRHTPLPDVAKLSAWEPSQGKKGGAMLYTFSYDMEQSRTQQPPLTWTTTIHDNLP